MKEESIKKLTYAVIDASIVASFLLPDEQEDIALEVFNKSTQGKLKLVSTTLLPYEVSNLLFACVKSRRIDKHLAVKLLSKFMKFKIELVAIDFNKALALAIESQISVYDASYLLTSQKEKAQLLTLDKQLYRLSVQN